MWYVMVGAGSRSRDTETLKHRKSLPSGEKIMEAVLDPSVPIPDTPLLGL